MSDVWGSCVSDQFGSWRCLRSELVELVEALLALDLSEIVEEWHDVTATMQGGLYKALGFKANWRVPRWAGRRSFEKYQHRVEWLRKNVYDPRGWTFCLADCQGGTNYEKPEKVQAIIERAKARIGGE